MLKQGLTLLPRRMQVLYGTGSLAFTLLERMLILYTAFYFLPPVEYGLPNLIPNRTYFGFFTVLGTAFLLGRIFDGFSDPFVAACSDNGRHRSGRRKPYMLFSALPFAILTLLVFFPPQPETESLLNGVWLVAMMCLFYIFYTIYVNPYLALLSELGHTNDLRINLSTIIGLFGIIGVVCVSVFFPELAGRLQEQGMELRHSFQVAALIFTSVALFFLFAAALSFNERKHCLPAQPSGMGVWKSILKTFSTRPFRVFLIGELFLQFAMNIITLGLIYYAVVIFKQEERFLMVISAVTVGVAVLSFPVVNYLSKKIGKKKMILAGVLILAVAFSVLFALSFNMTGTAFYIGLAMFGLGGIPLAILSILVLPVYADLAREDTIKTGLRREAMFFGARNLPLKLTIALAGAVFALLISVFGKDINHPLGIQLTMLVITVSCFIGYCFFAQYPEEQIQNNLREGERLSESGGTTGDMSGCQEETS